MPTPTLRLDTVERSSITLVGNAQVEVSRGFVIDGLDTTVDPSALAASALSVSGMPAMGTPHPTYNNALLGRIEIQGLLRDAVAGRLVYSTLQGITPTSYVITRSSRSVDHAENVLPNGTLIKASYLAPGADESQRIGPITCVIDVRRPCSTIVVEGLKLGPPNYAAADYVGFVNQGVWQGRATGCWLIDDFTTGYSVYEGYHSFRFVALGNVLGRPWVIPVTLIDPHTGQYVKVNPSDAASIATLDYSYGDIGDFSDLGMTPIGPYPTVSFSDFGF